MKPPKLALSLSAVLVAIALWTTIAQAHEPDQVTPVFEHAIANDSHPVIPGQGSSR